MPAEQARFPGVKHLALDDDGVVAAGGSDEAGAAENAVGADLHVDIDAALLKCGK